jgi:hypothetical protein
LIVRTKKCREQFLPVGQNHIFSIDRFGSILLKDSCAGDTQFGRQASARSTIDQRFAPWPAHNALQPTSSTAGLPSRLAIPASYKGSGLQSLALETSFSTE